MELKFVKNIQFTRLIKCDGQLKEFNFRKPNGRIEGPFTVDVIDTGNKRIRSAFMYGSPPIRPAGPTRRTSTTAPIP
jgi:hypothetical protein